MCARPNVFSSGGIVSSGKPYTSHSWTAGAHLVGVLSLCIAASAQGPAPESAPPMFPGGALLSCSSSFVTRGASPFAGLSNTARPTFSREGDFSFTWGFYRDFDLTVLVPIVTNRFTTANSQVRGTGLGDATLLVKY